MREHRPQFIFIKKKKQNTKSDESEDKIEINDQTPESIALKVFNTMAEYNHEISFFRSEDYLKCSQDVLQISSPLSTIEKLDQEIYAIIYEKGLTNLEVFLNNLSKFNHNKPSLTPSEALTFITGLYLTIKELHQKKIYHSDLFIHNILVFKVGDEFHLKINDFGGYSRQPVSRLTDYMMIKVVFAAIIRKTSLEDNDNDTKILLQIKNFTPGNITNSQFFEEVSKILEKELTTTF